MEKDPIKRFAAKLGVDEAGMKDIEKKAKEEIRKAVEFAESSPEPDVNTILEGIYA